MIMRQTACALVALLTARATSGFLIKSTSIPRVTRPSSGSVGLADHPSLSHAARVAEKAARAAGIEILSGMGAAVKSEKLNHKDIVTEVDGRCQEIIRQEIAAVFPSHHFLGEEDVPPGAAEAAAAIKAGLVASEWVWVVDPVDGTTNLAAGLPLVTSSIALARHGVVQVVEGLFHCALRA